MLRFLPLFMCYARWPPMRSQLRLVSSVISWSHWKPPRKLCMYMYYAPHTHIHSAQWAPSHAMHPLYGPWGRRLDAYRRVRVEPDMNVQARMVKLSSRYHMFRMLEPTRQTKWSYVLHMCCKLLLIWWSYICMFFGTRRRRPYEVQQLCNTSPIPWSPMGLTLQSQRRHGAATSSQHVSAPHNCSCKAHCMHPSNTQCMHAGYRNGCFGRLRKPNRCKSLNKWCAQTSMDSDRITRGVPNAWQCEPAIQCVYYHTSATTPDLFLRQDQIPPSLTAQSGNSRALHHRECVERRAQDAALRSPTMVSLKNAFRRSAQPNKNSNKATHTSCEVHHMSASDTCSTFQQSNRALGCTTKPHILYLPRA